MSDFEITKSTFYKNREVITPSEFSVLVRGYPAYLMALRTGKDNLPNLATKRGKREYYYLDEMFAWYENHLAEKAKKVEMLATRFTKIQEVSLLRQENNKSSRQALLDSLKK